MIAGVERFLGRWLRIPPPPEAPAGAPGSVRVFRAAPNFFRYRLLGWFGKQLLGLWGVAFGLFFLDQVVPQFPGRWTLDVIEGIGIAFYLLQLPLTFLAAALDYRLRWYLVTDRSLRIREGIWKIGEKTMSFANLQNLSIRQGPLQRLLGIEDLEVRTAGGGGSRQRGKHGKGKHQEDLHVGYFRGVTDAEEIKHLILARLRALRDSGLGDPEEAAGKGTRRPAPSALEPSAPGDSARRLGTGVGSLPPAATSLAAARELLVEASRLRTALAGRS